MRVKTPTRLRDFRHPIVFCRSSRTPDAGTGFVQTLVPYAKAWAGMQSGFMRRSDGVTAQQGPQLTVFITRANTHDVPEENDYILFEKDQVFQIKTVQWLDDERRHWRIDATEVAQSDTANFSDGSIVITETPPVVETDGDTTNPFWGDTR